MTEREMLKQGRQVEKDIAWLGKHMATPKGRRKIEKRQIKDAKRYVRRERMYEFFGNIAENTTVALLLCFAGVILGVIIAVLFFLNLSNIVQWILGLFR